MSGMRRYAALVTCLGFAALLCLPSITWAQTAPSLGTAAQFAVLGNSGVTGSTGSGTVVSGDVGSSPTATISNFPPSSVAATFVLHSTNDATVQQAHTDAKTAYDALAAQGTGTVLADNLSTVGALTSGVYSFTSGAPDLPAGATLTLNGGGIFVFNVSSTLTMNVNSVVAGTANACNVYWRVGTSATLDGTSFKGTVIADASITVGAGDVSGRALAGTGATGAVTMSTGGNTIGGCSTAAAVPTVTKAFSPTSITAGGVSTLTITLNNSNATAADLTAAFTDTLPSGVLVAATPNASTTCTGSGAVVATASGTTVTLPATRSIPAGSCTVKGDVTAAAPGTFVNTIAAGALKTSDGNNATAATATLTATCPTITIGPLTVPAGRVTAAYSQQLTASGGTGTYVYSVSSGTLPAGLTLSSSGLLSGTPTTVGSSTVTIQASDGNGCPGTIAYTIVVAAATCPVITVGPATVPAGRVAVAYSQQLTASGGTGTYVYSVLSGALPAGLTLSSGGLISGTPTTLGSTTVTIQASDGNGCPGTIAYTIVIAAGVPTLPQTFVILLALGLLGVGFLRLRRRA